ncbi:MAG TPA: cyanophycin synthetase [Thermomonas sp.]|uniref:cyanophycin synthetase n=1 Tax=Thermomonas sp. TaxID=1971895 RepID=UPI002B68F6E2|nr:cyanophycin synthetase [Thermomonas sp.]HOV95254.1 cyanophycin synthetase [Thermomonas sp.]
MKHNDITFLRITYLRGPNLWTYRPVLEAWVDIGDLEDYPSNKIEGFTDRLTAWLPGLQEHRCSIGTTGGFVQRLREGTWPAHILEHVTIELQNLAGMQTGFGKAREAGPRGIYKVAVRVREESVGRAALALARELLMAAINDTPFDVEARLRPLRELADRRLLGPSTAAIVDAASDRGIPHLGLNEGNLVQLGYGSRQRRIWTAETEHTSAIAESISRDKDLTKTLLASCGVPVPEGRVVDSAEDAWEAAEDIGLPVVVKPTDANHGRGVFADLCTREEIETAYAGALEEGSEVMVERFIQGDEHRMLVVGGKLVAANKGFTAAVVGDGQSTIRQLIDLQINSDPRRGEEEEFPMETLLLDREPIAQHELQRQGFTAESVPPAGQDVLILRHGNMAFDVTDEVHPDVAAAGVLAARIVGLDIAGIDLVTTDISKPLADTRGAIVEVNAGPSLLMHLKPAVGKPRPAGPAIVEHLFPAGDSGRVPVIGVLGRRQPALVAALIARLLHLSGRHVGLACGTGLQLDQRSLSTRPSNHFDGGERLLINRAIDAAVIETSARAILSEGLPYDRCHVAVVTDADSDASLHEFYIDTPERLFNVLRTQVDVVLKGGSAVLNAAEPQVANMAELCDGEVIFYASHADAAPLAEHLAEGGRAVFVRNGAIILAIGNNEEPLARLSRFALTGTSATPEHIEATLAAIAASWALDVPVDLIPAGIEHFEHEQAAAARAFDTTDTDNKGA